MGKVLLILTWSFVLLSAQSFAASPFGEGCDEDAALQKQMSAELINIVHEDQADRAGSYDSTDWTKVNPRDLHRRIKVAEIFAQGCINSAADYASAALVFQHGTTADHYYQAFHWANEAVKRGDQSQRWLAAAALDRYLVKIGQKQLFGTQFSKDVQGKFCIQPVEPSFPEARRFEYIKKSLKDNIAFVLKGIGSKQSPSDVKDCMLALNPSPKGSVPGFW